MKSSPFLKRRAPALSLSSVQTNETMTEAHTVTRWNEVAGAWDEEPIPAGYPLDLWLRQGWEDVPLGHFPPNAGHRHYAGTASNERPGPDATPYVPPPRDDAGDADDLTEAERWALTATPDDVPDRLPGLAGRIIDPAAFLRGLRAGLYARGGFVRQTKQGEYRLPGTTLRIATSEHARLLYEAQGAGVPA